MEDVDEAFTLIATTVDNYLPRLTARGLPQNLSRVQFVHDVESFLERLRTYVHRGVEEEWVIARMPREEATEVLRRRVFSIEEQGPDLGRLAEAAGLDSRSMVVPVLRLGAPLPRALCNGRSALISRDAREALLCRPPMSGAQWLPNSDGGEAIVVGPEVCLSRAKSGIAMARKAAGLLVTGQVAASGVVLCTDLLGEIATVPDALTVHLIAEKHLAPFNSLSPARRVTLGEALLTLIDTGKSIRAVAHDLGVQEQTMYNRIGVVKELIRGSIDDRNVRLELAVALRHALPGWRRMLQDSTN